MKKIFCLALLCLFLSVNSVLAASVEIYNKSAKDAKSMLVKYLIKQNLRIDNVTDYSMRTVTNENSFMTNLFYGSQYNSQTETRTFYNFVDTGKNCIISANAQIITNPNSGFESATRVHESSIQNQLDFFKKAIEGYYGYGFDVKEHIRNYEITNLEPNTEAMEKLNFGNRIYKINGKPVTELGYGNSKYYLTANGIGEKIILTIKTGKKQYKDVEITSIFIKPFITN